MDGPHTSRAAAQGDMSSPRRRARSSAATPLDVDDLLSEILLRLPPQPSSLPRASAVCRSWRGLVTGARFLRRFRLHHRSSPPLVGYYVRDYDNLSFVPTLEAPDRVPPRRLRFGRGRGFQLVGCRHGLLLFVHELRRKIRVWDSVTGEERSIPAPPGFEDKTLTCGAVLRAPGGGVHFQVVLVGNEEELHRRALAYVYSSETGVWGNLVEAPVPSQVNTVVRAVLVENSLYWLLGTVDVGEILEFDLERQSLAVIQLPADMTEFDDYNFTVIRAEGGGLGFLFVSYLTAQAQLWKRKIDSDGAFSWRLTRAIDLNKLLSLNLMEKRTLATPVYAEENNVLLLRTVLGIFTVQLESLQFEKLSMTNSWTYYLPFESVYTAGIGGGHNEVELLHNT